MFCVSHLKKCLGILAGRVDGDTESAAGYLKDNAHQVSVFFLGMLDGMAKIRALSEDPSVVGSAIQEPGESADKKVGADDVICQMFDAMTGKISKEEADALTRSLGRVDTPTEEYAEKFFKVNATWIAEHYVKMVRGQS